MTTTSTSVGQAILAIVESDVANVAGSPLVTFIEDCQAANGNLGLEAAALLKLEAAAPAAGIQLELTVQQQLLGFALNKLQTYLSTKAPGTSTSGTATAAAPAPKGLATGAPAA
jgi:hypothetical protein